MADEEKPRRQSRGKQPKSYRVGKEYSFLDEENGSASSDDESLGIEEPQEDGDDFMPDVEEEPEDDLEEDVASSESDEDNLEDRPVTPGTAELNIVELNSDNEMTPSGARLKRRKLSRSTPGNKGKIPMHITRGGGTSAKAVSDSPLRTRGVADFTKVGGQEVRLKDLFGPKKEDLKKIFSTRDHWLQQETLPLRKQNNQRRSFFENQEGREKEFKMTRQWYADFGRELFIEAQKNRTLSEEEGSAYLINCGQDSLNVLLGSLDTPKVYSLRKRSYINVAEPFKEKKNRRGWLFNLGSRIQDAHWATTEGNTQYLAVAVEQKPMTGPQPKPMENTKAPAFSATNPFSASIQIWAFAAGNDGELDISRQPQLQLVICTDWGAPKQFKWCPIDTSNREAPEGENGDEDVHIGLLAGIWSDGRVRILDISYHNPRTSQRETRYIHVSQAAFDVGFPQTVPSCLRWLSGTTVAVGTAIGALAIWTLSRPDTFATPHTTNRSTRPWFYHQISDTYILTLASGWPSQPQLISITTAGGFARLYDIRTPNADTTASIRGRTLSITQEWHEQTQSFIAPDEHYMLKHNPIRRYYHNLYSMRAESSITRCAASPVHPGILIGGADGRVEASNPIGRITNYKVVPWQQTWFAHDWRGPVKQLSSQSAADTAEMSEGGPVRDVSADDTKSSSNTISQAVSDQPLARITEGYTATQPGIANSASSKKSTNSEVGKGITVYEEAAAITALTWNPNVKCGTWAVAGMGDGLLRVEDVGV